MGNLTIIGSAKAATILRISRSRLQVLVTDGTLPAVERLPGRTGAYLFDRAAVEALAAERAR